MRFLIHFFLLAAVLASSQGHAKSTEESKSECTVAKEFVTALEYLRGKEDFETSEEQARQLATQVADGCSGSAQRFISIARAGSRAGLNANDAIKLASEFIQRSHADTETFLTVFNYAYAQDYLDMDVGNAIKLARSLSSEFEGDTARGRKDFKTVVEYCYHERFLNLPKPLCASLAAKIARFGQGFDDAVGPKFIEAFELLNSDTGANLVAKDALAIAVEVASGGASAEDTLIRAFKYASSPSGLGMGNHEAVEFAKKLALKRPSSSESKRNS